MNADDLAAKFAKKLGFGPAENKDATVARLVSAQEDAQEGARRYCYSLFTRSCGEIP